MSHNRTLAETLALDGRHVVIPGTDHFDLLADEVVAERVAEEISQTVRR